MLFYELNAATIFNVAHDQQMTPSDRRALIAQLLRLMACDTPIGTADAVAAGLTMPLGPTPLSHEGRES
jgi:hypothetical protein